MKKNSLFFPVFYLLILLSFQSRAQSISSPGFAGVDINCGTVIKNYPYFPDRKLASVAGLRLGSKLNGSKYWHSCYKFPDASIRLAFATLGNNKMLGKMFTIMYEFGFSQKLSEKFYLYELPSFGIAYFDRPFDEVTNPGNVAIGAHFSFSASAAFQLRCYFSPFISGQIQTSVFHSSDSHYKLPNLGINLPTFGAGINYHIKPFTIVFKPNETFLPDKKLHINLRLSVGHNEQGISTRPVNGPKYPIYLAAMYVSKNLTVINKIHTGLEFYYNTGVFDYITSQEFYDRDFAKKSTVLILDAGHEFLFGHFSLFTNGGIYLYNPFYRDKLRRANETDLKSKLKTLLIARLGFQYYLKDATVFSRHQLFAGIYIKTNLGQADFLETGLGYTF